MVNITTTKTKSNDLQITLNKPTTVGEFMGKWIDDNGGKWGTFYIFYVHPDGSVEFEMYIKYQYGNLIFNSSEEVKVLPNIGKIYNSKISSVTGVDHYWSVDVTIYITKDDESKEVI